MPTKEFIKHRENPGVLEFLRDKKPERGDWYSLDDIGFGRLFADCYDSELKWNVTRACWMAYNTITVKDTRGQEIDVGGVWRDEGGADAANLAMKDFIDQNLIYGTELEDEDVKKRYIKAVSRYINKKNRDSLLADARSEMQVKDSMLDGNKNLLNLQNGVLELSTRELIDQNPDFLCSKQASVYFNPAARCERWIEIISQICDGDMDKAAYLQKAFGYALTAGTEQECLFVLFGRSTRNGKTTLLSTVQNILGDYAGTVEPGSLAVANRNASGTSEDIARLDGMRFVVCSEPDEGLILDSARLKTFTGNDKIKARRLYQKGFEFKPQFKMFINTNFLPVLKDDTAFTSNRIRVIELNRHFTEAEQDKGLKEYFATPEAKAGILNWMLEGLEQYQLGGLPTPDCVSAATEAYRTDANWIRVFLAVCCDETPGKNSKAGELFTHYQGWAVENHQIPRNKKAFMQALADNGMLSLTGTVDGKTAKNVVKGLSVRITNTDRE